MTARK